MMQRIRFWLRRMSERLWVKPLFFCILSIAGAFVAQMAGQLELFQAAPELTFESIKTLLSVISASMLVMAVFAVGSMLSAYQSAGNSATPRAFSLVISDDVSQNALSTFIGAFIFSIVSLVALMNGYFDKGGRFALFLITAAVFGWVIIGFIKWVDRIARLGRLGTTIERVEEAAEGALSRRRESPFMGAVKASGRTDGLAVYGTTIGYIQRIDLARLQALARRADLEFELVSLPGTFSTPDRPLAYMRSADGVIDDEPDVGFVIDCFCIGKSRTFDDDPRFGLVALSEIAIRALSPAVNDPGTAIQVIGAFVRLFAPLAPYDRDAAQNEEPGVEFDRIAVPAISFGDMFDDAFSAMARDGSGCIEVVVRLLKALATLQHIGNPSMKAAALESARLVMAHAESALKLPEEIARLRLEARFVGPPVTAPS